MPLPISGGFEPELALEGFPDLPIGPPSPLASHLSEEPSEIMCIGRGVGARRVGGPHVRNDVALIELANVDIFRSDRYFEGPAKVARSVSGQILGPALR